MATQKVSERVYLIDTLALGEKESVAAYLLKGEKTALVDCGYATSTRDVLEALRELNVRPGDIDFVIPTHVHLDHAGAAGYLLDWMPKAKVIAQERAVPHLVDPAKLIKSATMVFGEDVMRTYGVPKGIDPERITAVGEELHVDLGGLTLTALHSPGHAPHQISVYVEEEKVLIAADAVASVYPSVGIVIPTTPPPSLDPAELGRTADRLGQMDSRILLAPHFGVRTDPKQVLEDTKEKTNDWVAQLREAKKSGATKEAIAAGMKKRVSQESGVSEDKLPRYVNTSINVSVGGIMHYLEKNP